MYLCNHIVIQNEQIFLKSKKHPKNHISPTKDQPTIITMKIELQTTTTTTINQLQITGNKRRYATINKKLQNNTTNSKNLTLDRGQ